MSLGAGLLLALLAIGWMWLVGWAIARFFCASMSVPEILAWSFGCGFVFQGRLYEALLLVGARAVAGSLIAAGGVVVAFSLLRRRPSTRLSDDGLSGERAWAIAAALAVPWLAFALESIAEPMWTTDYLAIWGLKAKIIFFSAAIPDRLFHDPFTFWSHPEYPLLLPLSLASLAAVLGRFDDQSLALLYPAFQAATILLLFGNLRRRVSLVAGAVAAAAAAFCFPLYRAVNAGSAEIPLAFALVLAATAFLDGLDENTTALNVRLLIASHLCASIKQEGTLFVGLLALACLVQWFARRERSRLIAALCLLLPLVLNVTLRRVAAGPQSRRDFDFTLLSLDRSSEWSERCLEVVRHLLRVEIPGAAFPVAGLVLFLLFSRRRREDILLPVLLAQVAAYAAAASFSAFDPSWQLESAFGRTTVTLVPALAVVLGARASSLTPAAHAGSQRTR